jgi:uncharacterized protein YjbJ (UPF0337 family)
MNDFSDKAQEAKGRLKEAAGAATDDNEMRHEGKADQTKAKVKGKIDDVTDAVKDKLD